MNNSRRHLLDGSLNTSIKDIEAESQPSLAAVKCDNHTAATDEDLLDKELENPKATVIYGIPPGHVPAYRAVFVISNAALGAGLLNFPQAYMKAGGVHIALSIQFALLTLIVGSFSILAHCASQSKACTYQDVVFLMLGNKFKILCQVLIAVYFFGSAITSIMIVGEQLSSVVEFASGQKGKWYTNKKFLFTSYSFIFLLPLCIPRRLKVLSYTSFCGGIGAFFITAIIITNYLNGRYKPDPRAPEIQTDWKSGFAAVPVICCGFQCHVSSVIVYWELKNRSIHRFMICVICAMLVCSATYGISGSFGYLTFGKSTKADILENYADDDVLVNIARVAILLILLSSFAIITFCARTVIDGFIIRIRKYDQQKAEQTERTRRVVITFCWFVFALLLAFVVPDIGVAISMSGGIASLFIFTFPGLCLLMSVDLKKNKFDTKDITLIAISFLYLVVGSFIFGEVTVLAIIQNIVGSS